MSSVHSLFRQRATAHPSRVALVWDRAQMTYGELDRRSDVLAARLVTMGVATDKRVGVVLPRSSEAIVAMLAVLKAGGAYVPIDPEYPPARRAFMIEDEWTQNLPPPKVAPSALATAIVKALKEGVEDVYPGEVAQEWLERWRDNPKVLERELASGGA